MFKIAKLFNLSLLNNFFGKRIFGPFPRGCCPQLTTTSEEIYQA